ncbi:hypothetical protein V8Q34_14855 [Blautia sp. JLR.GB0024]|uniref:hypothetical protein n=1 Tax=Blautia sp. JLR.GB0024 TaxID=3123295 RepID=UPI003005E29B
MAKVNLEEFAGGALQEKFDRAFEQVTENMLDVNTPYKNKRVITVKVALTQNESRDDSVAEVSVETKLAPASPIKTQFALQRDLKTGKVFACEYGPGIMGQMSLDDFQEKETVIDSNVVDTETGEIKEKKVVDLRTAKQA